MRFVFVFGVASCALADGVESRLEEGEASLASSASESAHGALNMLPCSGQE